MKIIVLFFILILCIAGTFSANISAQDKTHVLPAPNVIPTVTEKMQHAEFWISRIDGDPDRVIMTPGQIRDLNRKNSPRLFQGKDINDNPFTYDSTTNRRDYDGNHYYPENALSMSVVSGDSLRTGIKRGCDYVKNGNIYDRRMLPFSEEMRQEIIDAIDLESIPNTVYPRYGILTVNTLSRRVPSDMRAYNSRFDWWVDTFQKLPCETGMPVAILHESRDRDWYYINSEIVFAWVPARNVGVGTLEKVRELAEPDDFIVALAHKVPVYADRNFTIWITDLYQAARLKLVNTTSEGYRVLLPFRQEDGSLKAVDGWVKPDADVSVGYQPYTQRNMINTFFKLLYRPYGGGGVDHERDCT
ncbi:MAG: SH3 domain-containing protein, partial [Candidatus Latescibacteria bacterium]|nr:SH3 domain-containing protein [Candidatus Latescibacterota bacterium]